MYSLGRIGRRGFLRLGALLGLGASGALTTGAAAGSHTATGLADPGVFLDPVALDGSPAQAFASHAARANGLAKFFASGHPLAALEGQADEDKTITLIAHLHAVAGEPDFAVDGVLSRIAVPQALRRLNPGNGEVGTNRDYDMALKGLMVIAYRYRHLLTEQDFNFILDTLVPGHMSGGHPPEIEKGGSFAGVSYPESENHLLMIESSRYLINQLLRDRHPGDARFDNVANGLTGWLLGYLQTIARHDFHEFNSRPYARLSLHSLFNLHEFARDEKVRTAAQILLDYTMVKFAVSSDRARRVSPFRRLQYRINHQANWHNDLYSDSGDQVTGFFLGYTGMIDAADRPVRFPAWLTFLGLISSTAAYRPPPAAYLLAMSHVECLHRFHHGARPRVRYSPDVADGGVEIYYRSPSFLISAGGSFLNSGYGWDELDIGKKAWKDTSRAQATTLIPARADVRFHDLIRFEPYYDPHTDPYAGNVDDPDAHRTTAVNLGVYRRLAAGAHLRPGEKKTVEEHATSAYPVIAPHSGRLLMAWKGSGNDNLNVAKVLGTTLLGIDGVEGVEEVVTLGAASERSPALVSHGGRMFLAWRGSGNEQLNLAFSNDNGRSFGGTVTFGESSEHAPALVSHGNRLLLAWTGEDEHLNVARVVLWGDTNGGFGIEGLDGKVVLGQTSTDGPALASHGGRLFMAWKGSGNENLNLAFSGDSGATFSGATTFGETSDHAPALASHAGRLYYAWSGEDEHLNVARVVLWGDTNGGFGIEGLEAKVELDDFSTQAPALASDNGLLYLAWKGEGDDHLNLRVSRDGRFATPGPWLFCDLAHLGFYLAIYRTPPARPDELVAPPDNLAIVHAHEAAGLDFTVFRDRVLSNNSQLPEKLDLGTTHEFRTFDGKRHAVWFLLNDSKYSARIIDLSDPVSDLATLPLVSGEFLRAPGGHDGRIEIRHPGGEQAPVILDFRSAGAPSRTDNRLTLPQPWIDRALAQFALAADFSLRGRRKDALATLTEAVGLYDELLRLNPERNGPPLAAPVVQALARNRIDHSVAEADLRDWLANPLYTPYPAIAQTLLLSGWLLIRPVHVDVIVWNYEHTRNVRSPRKAADVRIDVLKAAILEGSNNRHGTQVPVFEQLLET